MPKVNANGINVYYKQYGTGPHLILIAGFTIDHTTWNSIIPLLEKYFTVTVFDNRGAGQTDAPDEPYSIEMMAKDTVGLMDALNIEKAFVLGHSAGGFILQVLLANYPERFSKGILVASRALPSPAYFLHIAVNAELLAAGVPREIVAKNAATFLFGDDYLSSGKNIDLFVKFVKDNPHPQSAIGLKRQTQASIQFDKLAWLAQIKTPLLAIYGNNDLIAPKRMLQPIKEKIPNVIIKTLKSCGHMPHFEKSEAFVQLIREFLL